MIAEGIDVAVRSGELADSRLVGRTLGEQHFVVCASPDYIRAHGLPATPADLLDLHCIHFQYPSSGRIAAWSFVEPYENLDLPRNLIFNNTYAGLYAAMNDFRLHA